MLRASRLRNLPVAAVSRRASIALVALLPILSPIAPAPAMAADGEVIGSGALSPEIARSWNDRPTTSVAATAASVSVRLDQSLAAAVQELEQHFIARALETSGGRVAEAAQLLGLSRKGLFLKRRRRGLVGRLVLGPRRGAVVGGCAGLGRFQAADAIVDDAVGVLSA